MCAASAAILRPASTCAGLFFILCSTDAGVFAPHAPLHHAALPVVRRFRLFPAGIRRSHRASCPRPHFPHPGVCELPLSGCFPSCRRPSPTASRMMLREHRPFDDQAPAPAAHPDATAPPQCRTSARPDSEQLQPAVQFRGSARLLRKNTLAGPHSSAKCFFAPPSPCQGHSFV